MRKDVNLVARIALPQMHIKAIYRSKAEGIPKLKGEKQSRLEKQCENGKENQLLWPVRGWGPRLMRLWIGESLCMWVGRDSLVCRCVKMWMNTGFLFVGDTNRLCPHWEVVRLPIRKGSIATILPLFFRILPRLNGTRLRLNHIATLPFKHLPPLYETDNILHHLSFT